MDKGDGDDDEGDGDDGEGDGDDDEVDGDDDEDDGWQRTARPPAVSCAAPPTAGGASAFPSTHRPSS